jgi:hypothetical protein
LRIYESDTGQLYLKPRFEDAESAMKQIEQLDAAYAG